MTTDQAGGTRRSIFARASRHALGGLAAAVIAALAVPAPASAQEYISSIQQVSSGRFVDAHEVDTEDYRLVTRPAQNNNTQLWHFVHLGNGIYTIQQLSSSRYVDAHEYDGEDYRLVTRPQQNNDTQRWQLTALGNGIYTIQQVSNGRFVDAHEYDGEDYRLVTRPAQNNSTQMWRISPEPLVPAPQPQPPQPQPPQPQPPQPQPPQAQPIYSAGTFDLVPATQVNLDNGNVGFFNGDLQYQTANFNTFNLVPANGAAISVGNNLPRGFAGCSAAPMSQMPVPAGNAPVGTYVCVRTSEGRISEFRVDSIGLLMTMTLTYTTWQ